MVAGKVKQAMGLTSKPDKPKPKPTPSPNPNLKHPPPPPPSPPSNSILKPPFSNKKPSSNRSFGAYFPRASAQVQPRPPEISVNEVLKVVDELRERESRLKTELVEVKLRHEMAASEIAEKCREVAELTAENERLVTEVREKDGKIVALMAEMEEVKQSQRFLGLVEVSSKSSLIKNLNLRKSAENLSNHNNGGNSNGGVTESVSLSYRNNGGNCGNNNSNSINGVKIDDRNNGGNCSGRLMESVSFSNRNNGGNCSGRVTESVSFNNRNNGEKCSNDNNNNSNGVKFDDYAVEMATNCRNNSFADEIRDNSLRCIPRVPKPPPKRCFSDSSSCKSENVTAPPPPPPPPAMRQSPATVTRSVPPPPPPPPAVGGNRVTVKVKRVPEVVEFYHSLMRRDSRKEGGSATTELTTASSARDLVGEIENRSAYLLAIKTDVETQGDFIRFLIKEVETACFIDIEEVVSFVKWLDDELSYLVDERAVLKHFDWPEKKADGLREAAFEYSDLKKLESEASSFRHDARQACSTTLKKMQTLLEKLEHGVYNLSRLRESAANRYKSFQIPVDWMLDTGFVSQIKLASVKLAMKYMKRVLAELEIVGGGPEEEELIVQGVRFAFRVHQFAGGFDVETMRAFEELRDKARSYHLQCQKQQQQRLACRSMP
ncbi:protein INCREASED PETAL GROWTH ANISOTROPY 1-like [Silene latifolia]|uniref:protein INCREASED PETAL GROWTH ANISOTROPY 1-like n=1 Tax=Silene latifolia TaxID=37657 RepID=UPI003D78ACAB